MAAGRHHHVWIRHSNGRWEPGLVLTWRLSGGDWTAWCVWIEAGTLTVTQGWIPKPDLRPLLADPPTWG